MPAASLDTSDDLDAIVAGIAHDFGNILAAVTNYVSLASRRIDDPETVELLDQASVVARRAARLNRQLHDLGDCGTLVAEPVLLHEVLGRIRPLLEHTLCERCALRVDLAGEPVSAVASGRGLEMALGHLVQSACDAMPEGGLVTIRIRSADASGQPSRVELTVSDEGVGASPDGLGLTIVGRVMARLGGVMHVHSVVGGGTTVTLELEAVDANG